MTGYDEEQQDLVALYAMDALDEFERARAERIVAGSPEAARDLARYTDALAATVDSTTAVEPPAHTWDAISATIRAGTSTGTSTGTGAGVPASAPETAKRRSGGSRGRWLAVAAAVLVAVLALVTVRSLTSGTASSRSQMTAALTLPTTRSGSLSAATGSAKIALEENGTGWVDLSSLPDPGAGNVYQLWSLDSGTPVSLGVVKPSGGVARFSAPAGSKTLALSKEKAPGASSPTLPPVGAVQLD